MADKRISQLVERVDIANNDVLPIVASGATTTNKVTISSIQTFMQGNLDLGVTSVGITLGTTGTDVNVSGSPITTSGNITINFPTASATNRGLLSSADWTTFNSKQPAGNYVTLDTTQTITAQKTFTTSGSSDTMIISHGSGSGIALDVIKAGNSEAIRVTKTSGSGNAMTISGGNFEAGTIVKTGGTSTQYLMADGSTSTLTNPVTGTGASGQVAFWNGTSSQTGDNGLFWDNTNKRLGIGTSTPVAPFDINATGFTQFRIKNATLNQATGVQMFNDLNIYAKLEVFGSAFGTLNLRNNTMLWSQGDLAFGSGLATRQEVGRFTSAGNLLVGTTTDAGFRLDVNGTARVQGELTVNGVNIGLGGGSISTNTRVGVNALQNNTTGGSNTAYGSNALQSNTVGFNNTANSRNALQNNTTGHSNTADGLSALSRNTTGNFNTAFGFNSGRFIADGITDNTITNNSIFIGVDTRANADNQTNQIVIGHTAIGLGSNTTVLGNTSTTHGRWFGNLLVGTSTNNGTNLRVVGTTQSDIITQNLASHGRKVLQYGPTASTTINLPTEFPLMTGLVVANAYAVFGKFLGKYLNYGQAIEFYIAKNPNGIWNAVAYSASSQFLAALISVTGSGNDLTITTSTDTSFILELTVMTQS